MESVSWWGGSVSKSSPDSDKLSGAHRPNCSAEGRGTKRRVILRICYLTNYCPDQRIRGNLIL